MGRLDARLSVKLREHKERQRTLPAHEVSHEGDLLLEVNLIFQGDLAPIVAAGFQSEFVAGTAASGKVYLRDLEKVADAPGVVHIGIAHTLSRMLDTSVPAIGAALLHTGTPAYTGTGVIVGLVDSGVDITHKTLRKGNGDTRIVKLWDQTLQTGGSPPPGYTKGVLFTANDIDTALHGSNPDQFPSKDSGHGTHTAGIAAGNGSQSGNCHLADHYVGVAPEALVYMVKTTFSSDDVVKGIQFIFNQAAANQGCVVNISLGSDFGAHDGKAWLDTAINALVAPPVSPAGIPGRVVVAASGNGGHLQHARKTVTGSGAPTTITFSIQAGNRHLDFYDLWYGGASRVDIQIRSPLGGTMPVVAAGSGTPSPLPTVDGHTIEIQSRLNDAVNGLHEIYFSIRPPAGGAMANGSWTILLTETAGTPADVNFWLNYAGRQEESRDVAASATETFGFGLWRDWKILDFGEILYTGAARLDLVITTPDGDDFPVVVAGAAPPASLSAGGHFLDVSSVVNVAGTNRILFQIRRDTSGILGGKHNVTTGSWRIRLTETAGSATRVTCRMPGDRFGLPKVIPADQDPTITVGSPAAADHVIAVGNYNHRTNTLADDSGRGPRLDHVGLPPPTSVDELRKPDVVAPGESIISAKTGAHGVPLCCDCCVDFYVAERGTSMAAPHVTGVVALMLQKTPGLTVNDVRHNLRQSATSHGGASAYHVEWGWGTVNAGGAVGLSRSLLPDVAAEQVVQPGLPWFEPISARLKALRGTFGAIPAGQLLISLVSQHYDEVARLVRTVRRCAAVWRHMGGTEMLRQLLLWRDSEAAPLPAKVAERPLTSGIRKLFIELSRVASPGLKRDIVRYGDLVLALPGAKLVEIAALEEPSRG